MGKKLEGGPPRCDSPYAGTRYGYTLHIYRRKTDKTHIPCDACRAAAAESQQDLVKKRLLNGATTVRRKSSAHYQLAGGFVLLDATGTRRRLQALFVMGYSWLVIAERLGMNRVNVAHLARDYQKVYPATMEKVRALYEELSMVPAPEDGRKAYKVARTLGRRYGYAPPLAWDEDINPIDDPFVFPMGMSEEQEYKWFWNAASMTERINWVLKNGLGVTRSNWYNYRREN